MLMKTNIFVFIFVFLLSFHLLGNNSNRKVALIIANANYQISPLKNPINDGKLMEVLLNDLGFDVLTLYDGTQEQMKRKMNDFEENLKNAKISLFYYAGHGLQVNGSNYLIPIDAQIKKENEIDIESVDLNRILNILDSAKTDLNVIVLDACRDNPFKKSWRSTQQGLAATLAPTGVMIAYATAPGQTASDGEADHGIYTQALANHIKTPGLAIESLFKKVRQDVIAQTQNQQVPWESSSLVGDFYFLPIENQEDTSTSKKEKNEQKISNKINTESNRFAFKHNVLPYSAIGAGVISLYLGYHYYSSYLSTNDQFEKEKTSVLLDPDSFKAREDEILNDKRYMIIWSTIGLASIGVGSYLLSKAQNTLISFIPNREGMTFNVLTKF